MNASVEGTGSELTISIDASEVEKHAGHKLTDAGLKATLPGQAPAIANGVAGMLAEPPEPREPRSVHIWHVQLTRTVVIAEYVIELAEPVEVYT